MAEVTFTQSELEALGAKLGSYDDDFTDNERALLSSIFARGIQGVYEDAGADVEGFLLPAVRFGQGSSVVPLRPGQANGIIAVVDGDGAVLPAVQFSLNFTKTA